MKIASDALVRSADREWQEIAPGVRRQVLVYGEDLMLVAVRFTRGAVGAIHHHPHRQASFVSAGRFEVTVGDDKRILETGDAFFTIADIPHGVVALEDGILVDTFTPARAEFLEGKSQLSSYIQPGDTRK